MRTRQTSSKSKPQPDLVRCCDCSRCTRDTSGPSFSLITHEYFMGTCPKGHTDGRILIDEATGEAQGHVFMNKARVCLDFDKGSSNE